MYVYCVSLVYIFWIIKIGYINNYGMDVGMKGKWKIVNILKSFKNFGMLVY